jgi:hypothetical protein
MHRGEETEVSEAEVMAVRANPVEDEDGSSLREKA